MWAHPPWLGTLFPADSDPLSCYATWCTAVEGNTTFYATPSPKTVDRWLASIAEHPGFRFCFKLPRTITHERRLRRGDVELSQFLDVISPLLPWLGPVQIQLPPSFGPDDLSALGIFLDGLPRMEHDWAVEVRNPAFFPGGSHERVLNDQLAGRGVNRVLLDSRPLFAGPCRTPGEIDAFKAKPRVPVRPVVTGGQPIVRLIGQTDPSATEAGWQQWLPKVTEWLAQGLSPYVFIHTPDNVESPALNRHFYRQAQAASPGLPDLPEPIEADIQLDLFGS